MSLSCLLYDVLISLVPQSKFISRVGQEVGLHGGNDRSGDVQFSTSVVASLLPQTKNCQTCKESKIYRRDIKNADKHA